MSLRVGTFPKVEHLKSQKQIEQLFQSGTVVKAFPIRAIFEYTDRQEGQAKIQAAVSVSKRNFKRAVDRNRIKRLMREALRYQKQLLEDSWAIEGKCLTVFFIYVNREPITLPKMDKAFEKFFKKLNQAQP